jgi:hypothetical protein
MNVFGFVLLVSTAIVVLTIGIDVCSQLWAEKQNQRQVRKAQARRAEALLYASIRKNAMNKTRDTVELRVVSIPQKSDGGRHRLSAA